MAGERSLAVVVTANLAQMRAELAKADTILATTTSAMRKMSDAYDGSRTIANANAAMLQIQKLGGTTGLTEAEQRKLNAALTEGVAKYQALGKQAPAEMISLRDATADAANKTTSLTDKLKGAAGALGLAFGATAVIGGIKSLVTNTLDYASTIDDTSKKLGISIEATQRYKFAAEQTGASLENVAKSVLKLSQQLAGGDKGVKEALDAAGLSFDAIRAMKPEEAFDAAAAAIAKIPDPMTQAKVALELFGKGGAELLPAIREGFDQLAASASTMSDKTITALAAAQDKWDAFAHKITVATGGIVGKVLGMAERIAPAMVLMFAAMGDVQSAEIWSTFAKGVDDAAASTDRLAASFQKTQAAQVAAAVAAGQSVAQVAAAYGLTVAQVNAMVEAANKASEGNTKLASSLQKQADAYSKAGLLKDTAAHVALLKQIAKDGGFAGDGLEKFSKVAAELRARGAVLTPELFKMATAYEDVNRKALPLVTTLQSIAIAMRAVQSQTMGSAPDSFEATPILTSIKTALGAVHQFTIGKAPEIAKEVTSAFSSALDNLGATILGAIQGGGSIGKSIGASLLGGLGDDLGKKLAEKIGGSLGKALGSFAGPLGTLLGSQIGGLVDKLIGSNDTKKDREAAARAMGFSSISAMNDALNKLGTEGQALVHQGLNVIGKKDAAANQAWIASVQALFDKQKAIAEQSTNDAAAAQAASLAKITDPLKAKLKEIDTEYQRLSDSIAKEAPEEIMGVIEAQERAALADLAVQREVTENELKAAETKVLDTATVIREGIERLFKDPIRVMFDLSNFPQTGRGAAYGGAMAEGGSGIVNRPTWFLAGEAGPERYNFTPMGSGGGGNGDQTIVVQMGDDVILRKVVRGMPRYLKLIGAQ